MHVLISSVAMFAVCCVGVSPLFAAEPPVLSQSSVMTLPLGNDIRVKGNLMEWDETLLPAVAAGHEPTEESLVETVERKVRLQISSGFGGRFHPSLGIYRAHRGIDIPGPRGAMIQATESGVVTHAGWMGGYGNLVEINHGNGLTSRYGHLERFTTALGAYVQRGEAIGNMGSTGQSTGTHLHFEVRSGGVAIDPIRYLSTGISIVAKAHARDQTPTISKFASARTTPLMLKAATP